MVCIEQKAGTAVCALHVCTVLCLLFHVHMQTCHAHRDEKHATSTSAPHGGLSTNTGKGDLDSF